MLTFGVTASDKIQNLGSVTGRIGYVPVQSLMLYFKGGYAWADNEVSASGFGVTFAESRFHSGGTLGAGLEYMFVPNLSAKLEYMWTDYAKLPGQTVKAGLIYHFFGRLQLHTKLPRGGASPNLK